jgi:hypothetical protein
MQMDTYASRQAADPLDFCLAIATLWSGYGIEGQQPLLPMTSRIKRAQEEKGRVAKPADY